MKLNIKLILVMAVTQVKLIMTEIAMSPDPEVTCNSRCQCSAGIPGIPGSNGQHGQHGSVGLRGDAGSPGEVGEPGAKGDFGSDGLVGEPGTKGDHGQKGEQGVSQPGKQGPQGLPGMDGLKGERGGPRPAGQTGEAGKCSQRRSAFTAVKKNDFSPPTPYDPLPFEELLFSEEGTDFNLINGTFTCTMSGIYFFAFSVLQKPGVPDLRVHLRMNSHTIVSVAVSASNYHQASNSAIILMHNGDQVYLTVRGQVNGRSENYTSFTGFILHEI